MYADWIDPYTGLHVLDPIPVDLRFYGQAQFRVQELQAAYIAVLQPNGFMTIKSGFKNPDGTDRMVTVTGCDARWLKKALIALQPRTLNPTTRYIL